MPDISIRVTADVQNAQEALQRIPQQMRQIQAAGVPAVRAGDTALKTFNQTAVVSSRSISAATGSMRFMAVGLVSQLSPALGSTVSQFASLGTVVAATGGSLLTIAGTAGVGALVVSLGFLIRHLTEARQVQELFEKAMSSFDPSALVAQIDLVIEAQNAFMKNTREFHLNIEGLSLSIEPTFAERAAEASERFADKLAILREALVLQRDTAREAKDELAAMEPAAQKAGAAVQEMGETIDAATRSLASALLRAAPAFGSVEEAARAAGIAITTELQAAIDGIKADPITRVNEALREQQEEARAAAAEHREAQRLITDGLKKQEEAWKKNQAEIEKTADAVANVFSDTLFDALEGRITDVGDFFKRTFINAAKDASRDMFKELSRGILGGGRGGAGSGFPFGSATASGSVLGPGTLTGGTTVAAGPASLAQLEAQATAKALGSTGLTTGGIQQFLGQAGQVAGPIALAATISMAVGSFVAQQLGGGKKGAEIGSLIGGVVGGVIGGLLFGRAERRARQRKHALSLAESAIQSSFGVLRNAEISNPAVIQVVDELSNVAQLADRISGRAEGFAAAFVALNQAASRFAAGGMSELEFLRQIRSAMFANPGTIRGGAAGTLGELLRAGIFQDVAPTLTRLVQVGAESIFREGVFQMSQRAVALSLAQFLEVDFPSLPAGGGDGQRGFISQVMDIQSQLRDHSERLERVEDLARDILPMGFGVLGRAFEGMSATRRFQMLVNEIGLIEGERLKLAEALG